MGLCEVSRPHCLGGKGNDILEDLAAHTTNTAPDRHGREEIVPAYPCLVALVLTGFSLPEA